MIYTIGKKENYLKSIANSPTGKIQKVGKTDDLNGRPYEGGYAFQSREDAQRRIDEAYSDQGYAVFGLDADWERDTEPHQGDGWWHSLLINVDIIVFDVSEPGVEMPEPCGDIPYCDIEKHRWVDSYYGVTCSVCGQFVPDGCGWWMPVDDDYDSDDDWEDGEE
jgi:hypothetical protein